MDKEKINIGCVLKPVTFNERTIMLSDVVLSGNNYACIVQQSTFHGLR